MGDIPEVNRSGLQVEPLASHHDRAAFSCGTPELDHYIQRYARQDGKRDLAQCFVLAPHAGSRECIGYYTLSSHGIEITALPPDLAQRLPSNILLPATLLGRLAVATPFQDKGYGTLLLLHALRSALGATRQIALIGVVVDALTDELAPFYTKRGFIELLDRPRHIIVPMNRLRAMFPEEAARIPDATDLIERASGIGVPPSP